MAIRTGIGVGEAQVFDNSSVINTYAKLLAQQKKEQEKYQSELADIMATVKTEGVRDADKPIIANTYSEIKNLYSNAVNAKDPQERALNRSLIREKISSLNEYSARSNQFAKEYKAFAAQMAPNVLKYDTKKIDEFKGMANKSLMELGEKAVINPFDYTPNVDDSVRDDIQSDIYKQEEKRIGANDYIKEKIAGTGERYVGVADKNRVINDITTKLSTNPKYRQLAYSTYADMNPDSMSPDIEDVIANELKMYEQKFGYKYEGNITRTPKASGSAAETYVGPSQVSQKNFYSNEGISRDSAGNRVRKPSRLSAEFSSFVGVNPQQFSLPQIGKVLNISKAKWEPYRPSGNVEIVGVGVRPGGQYNVVIQDKDGVEYMINEESLPIGIRNNKLYKAARSSVFSNRPSTQTKPKSKKSDPLNLGI